MGLPEAAWGKTRTGSSNVLHHHSMQSTISNFIITCDNKMQNAKSKATKLNVLGMI
jgi:hypothetical protein